MFGIEGKRISDILLRNRRPLFLLAVFVASVSIGIVGAAVYNFMGANSNIGVEQILISL